jgi:acid stress-induced BolA-like protein IbaG/YrbA
MECAEIKEKIQTDLPKATVEVKGDGYHYEVIVIAEEFVGQSLIARQRKIMSLFKNNIQDGSLHALSIQAKTPEEWSNK